MRLKKFTINQGGKFNIDTTGPVVIDFTNSKMVGATGDETVGKSTLLQLFLMACGQNGGKKIVEALKNADSEKIDVDLSFVGNDKKNYDVKVKNGDLTIKCEGQTQRGGEVTLLKQQLGVVGVSPMDIKNKPVDDIVKWLASYSTKSAEEFEKSMKKIKDGIKVAKQARASANNTAKGLREYLKGEGVMSDSNELIEKVWNQKEKDFKDEPDVNALSKKLSAAGVKSDKFIQNEGKVSAQKERRTQIEKAMKELQKELDVVNENIAISEKWLKDNEAAKKEYDLVKKQYDTAVQDAVDYNKWQDIKAKKKELDQFEDAAIKADNKEKDLLKQQQELQWEVIPDIQGLELVLEDTHEDEGEQKKAGFYLNGFSSAQMSNSEWLTAVIKILKKNKVPVLVIDDVSQFGSTLMATLEGLAKANCYVLYAEMSRGTTELEIQYK